MNILSFPLSDFRQHHVLDYQKVLHRITWLSDFRLRLLSGSHVPTRLYSVHTDIQKQVVGKRGVKECVFQAILPKQNTGPQAILESIPQGIPDFRNF